MFLFIIVFVVTGIRRFDSNIDQIPVIYVGHKLECSYCQQQFSLSGLYVHINVCSTGKHAEVKKLNAWKRRVKRFAEKNNIDYNKAEQILLKKQEEKNSTTISCITDPSIPDTQETHNKRTTQDQSRGGSPRKAPNNATLANTNTSIQLAQKAPRARRMTLSVRTETNTTIEERKEISKTKTKNSQDRSRDQPKKRNAQNHSYVNSQNEVLNESLEAEPKKTDKTVQYFEEKLKDIENIWVQGSIGYPLPNIIIPTFWIHSPFYLKPGQLKKLSPGKLFYVIFVII